MKSFYQEWLRKNYKENQEAKTSEEPNIEQTQSTRQSPIPSTSRSDQEAKTSEQTNIEKTQSTRQSPSRSTSRSEPESNITEMDPPITSSTLKKQSDIVFENGQFVLYLQKEAFLRQKRFNLQDHLFHIKIKLKNNNDFPFLKDILDFLEQGLLHIIKDIKKFYDKKDANVCFLTLFQEPMVNALNSGKI